MIGKTISHYEILEKLGEGGMGVVYKAIDTKLDRHVAIKVLPPHLMSDEDAKTRFVHEAKAASGLDHPPICTIHEIDQTDDGQMFIAMGFYEGESLATRLERGPLPIGDAVALAMQIASGLAKAHAQDIIHRDIKPGNIIITADNQAKIVDFGLAKLAGRTALTKDGSTVGTVSYMSPEQAQGGDVDHRADVWALGVVLYEMVTGRRPFDAEHEQAVVYRIINDEPAAPASIRTGIPAELGNLIAHALTKAPASRTGSMGDFLSALSALVPGAAVAPAPARPSRSRTVALIAAVVAVLSIATFSGIEWKNRNARVNWARNIALPEAGRLINDDKAMDAYLLLQEAGEVIPDDPLFQECRTKCSKVIAINSTPPGADIYIKSYHEPDGDWLHLGTTPIDSVWVPYTYVRWRVVAAGYAPLELAFWNFWPELGFPLIKIEDVPEGMVRVYEQGRVRVGRLAPVIVEPFWIDKYEVTNRKYKAFVDAGGYRDPAFWKEPLVVDGREIPWKEGMALFEDATGRPGPSTWAQGSYPGGQDDYPVRGVSWYEANAYAEFAGKKLPTIFHWRHAAAASSINIDMVLLSNIDANEPAPVGSFPGLGRFGTYDMAGNVKEWCWNEADNARYALGGDWDDMAYRFADDHVNDPFARDDFYGFRCILPDGPLSESSLQPAPALLIDYNNEVPVDDATFAIYRAMYNYDKGGLDAKTEKVDDSADDWHREKVSFTAAYGDERLPAWIFIPRNIEPPYQCAVFFPGAGALEIRSSDHLSSPQSFDFILRSGRVLVYPVYQNTYERQLENYTGGPNQARDLIIQWTQDVQRTVDYVASRGDIDMDRIAFYGVSLGATYGPIYTAVETRFATAVYVAGGLYGLSMTRPPEVLPFNFLTRNTTPALMVNGRYDFELKLETAVEPMFHSLAVSDADKRLAVFDSDHLPKPNDIVRETLDWLDRYLGPVEPND
jgi:hypothetical protein